MANIQRPKIIWLHSHFLYWMGGTKFVFELLRRLKKDFDITVVVENASLLAVQNYKKENIKLISLKKQTSTSPFYWLFFPLNLYRDYLKIRKIFIKENAVAVGSSMFPMNILSALLTKNSVQYCFEPFAFFHDPEFIKDFSPVKRLFIQIASFFYKRLDIWATGNSNILLTLNNTTAAAIKNIYKRDSILTYTGIDTNHFKPFVSDKLKKKYNGQKIIIHSTDYTPVKRTDAMIKIFAEVLKQNPLSKLLITSTIDNKVEKERLSRLSASLGILDKVEFLGFVDYDLLPQYYSLAYCLVQTSYSQKSGTTSMALPVKEALACGTPCIRYPIKNEDVIDSKTGFLVDPRNTKKMAEAILNIFAWDKSKRESAALTARNSIVKRYTWENTSNIVKRALDSIIQVP